MIGDAGIFIPAGSVSGLASSRVQAAGSGHCGESSEHPTRFRVATWNVGFAYPGVRDNRSTLNTKTGYDEVLNSIAS